MEKRQYYFSLALALILILSMIPPAFGAATEQTGTHWAAAPLNRWQERGVVHGYEDGSFRPDGKITRAEFVTIINKIFGVSDQGDSNFSDVPASAWFAVQMAAAKAAGYYEGFPDGSGKPAANINRQDAAALMARVLQLKGGMDDDAQAVSGLSFSDAASISPYAREAVQTLAANHALSGYADGTFRPQQDMTRAEAITLIDRLVAAYYAVEGDYTGGLIASHTVINQPGVTLKNSTLSRNLYLARGIRNGDVTLNGVQVKGTAFIWGGESTISVRDSILQDVLIDRKNGRVRLHAGGTTKIVKLIVNSSGTIELDENASIDHLIVNHPAAILIPKGTVIHTLVIHPEAANTIITGEGDIEQADVRAKDVMLNGQPLPIGTAIIVGGKVSSPSPDHKPSTTAGATSSNRSGSSGSYPGTGQQYPVIDLADAQATDSTRSLFAYLQEIRGKHILFGHQHPTDEVLSTTPPGQPKSETYSAVGDYPAMFGWDTLSLEGFEKPGSLTNTPQQNRDNLVASMKEAYKLGGVLSLSAHMPNFVTGGDFYDTSGNVVSHILPGGDKHEDYNAFLDRIADFTHHLKDENGNLIPVIFRPFHEQNGGWFWWGAPYTTKEQYIEIYRYTVEYLRDEKGVRNFLYAFSPGSPFNNSEATFLKTYPGDDYVDILGFDTYYDGNNQAWFEAVVDDAKLISQIADARGKVAAFTEFGYSNVKPTGTADLHFFTKLSAALQSDPDAKRMAYMLTWANFNYNSIFVPYRNSAMYGDHELLPDFEQYYADPYTYFSRDLSGVYNKKLRTAKEKPFMHIVSPTGQETIRNASTTIRAKVLNQNVSKVVYLVGDEITEHEMSMNDKGFYAAEWQPPAELNGKETTLTVKTYGKDHSVLSQTITIYIGIQEKVLKQFTFDQDIAGVASNGNWPDTIQTQYAHGMLANDGKLKINVSGLTGSDSWQELKIGLPDIAGQVTLPYVNRVSFEAWIPAAAGDHDAAHVNLRAAAELPPNNTKFETTSVTAWSELPRITIGGEEYVAYSALMDLTDQDQLAAAEGLQLALIGSGLNYDGPIYVDNIRLINAYTGETNDPAHVDDFDGYKGSNELLRSGYSPNGDANSISLDAEHKQSGQFGLKLDYTLAGQGYTGITKNLGSRDWSQTGKLKFWLEPDGSGKKLVIQIKANDIHFEYYPSLADSAPRWIEIPFKDFSVAPWDSANQSKKLDTTHAKKVQAFSIYVNALANDSYSKDNPFLGTLYLDSIHVIPGSSGDIPKGEDDGTDPGNGGGIQPGTLYGFETDTAGWEVEATQNFANAAPPTVTTDVYAEGIQSLLTTFELDGTSFELTKYADFDFSGLQALNAKVKLSTGSAHIYFYVKTGSSWTWYDSGITLVEASEAGFKTLSIDLSQVENLHQVKSLGFKIEPVPGETGAATLYIDDISLF
ncbi:glycosyl hydrolase [Paenibacillus woosongensis]|uniref:Beta-mannosidase n=1 Tax=Paenibacillus woosongensis TaxID=307580 RepID=A0A7X2Z5K2_9BACL|nr:glycosyl hydrolase [Paenibacillus woosongensis]MUG48001.1 beta-mannosidase [Paenibacillus woosongensis]